jgi:nucleoside-diphosphate-sugar epimerase
LLSAASGFGTIVANSSGAVYADEEGRSLGSAPQTGFPRYPEYIHETQPTVEPDGETYAGRKVTVERMLLDRAATNTSVLRPCAVYGPFAKDLREVWFLKRMKDGRSFVPLAYDGESCFHTCAASTIASAVVSSAKSSGTRILNVGDGNAPTVRRIGEILFGGEAGPELLCFPGPPQNGVGMSPWSVPFPIRLDISALTELMGRPPLYEQMVAPAARWALDQLGGDWTQCFPKLAAYSFPLFDYAAEDSGLNALRSRR